MTEKRYKLIESDPCEDPYDCRMYVGILEDDVEELYDYNTICDRLNELADENEQLKQFPIKLDDRIQKLKEDLEKLTEMDKSDLNPQAVEDVATVIGMSLNALIEFKKEVWE